MEQVSLDIENPVSRNLVIRHSRLSHPYDDYNLLSYQELAALGTGEIQPSINPASRDILEGVFSKDLLGQIKHIVHSPSTRAVETSHLIAETAGSVDSIVEEANLSEVAFDMSKLVSEEEYLDGGLMLVVDRVFRGMLGEYPEVESIESQWERIHEVFSPHQGNSDESEEELTLYVTHGFFMRTIQLYVQEKGVFREFQVEDFYSVENFSYLNGFFIPGV